MGDAPAVIQAENVRQRNNHFFGGGAIQFFNTAFLEVVLRRRLQVIAQIRQIFRFQPLQIGSKGRIIMRSGISDGLVRIIKRQMDGFGTVAVCKTELKNPGARPAVFGKQTICTFGNAAQILGNQFHAAGFRQPGQFWDKYVVFGIRAVIPAFADAPQTVIAYKTNRMVDADNIIQTGIKAKTLQVPAEFVRSGAGQS